MFLISCKNDPKNLNTATAAPGSETEAQVLKIESSLLIGSWKDKSDTALDFSMMKDGTARSDNMKTLVYKNWKLNEGQLTLVFESIGNGISFIDSTTYKIEKLTDSELMLRDGTYISEYTKKK